jgi:hypothetical protein
MSIKLELERLDVRNESQVNHTIREAEALLEFLHAAKKFAAASANGRCGFNGKPPPAANPAPRVKVQRQRATTRVMEDRRRTVAAYLAAHGPAPASKIRKRCGLANRHLFYQAMQHPWFVWVGANSKVARWVLTDLGRREAL